MGYGDAIMATGMARASRSGKRIAFGVPERSMICWDSNAEKIFKNNPRVARPNESGDFEWIRYYKGHRIYNDHDRASNKWVWNKSFRAQPGEIYLDRLEVAWTSEEIVDRVGTSYAIVEPNVPTWKPVASNKQWPVSRYQEVTDFLRLQGIPVVQLAHGEKHVLKGVHLVRCPSFRHAIAALIAAQVVVGPEGGLHHAAAARLLSADGVLIKEYTRAVVIFGGFIPPSVTGYDFHDNVAGSAVACGSLAKCDHCRDAMASIPSDRVIESVRKWTRTQSIASSAA